MQSCSLTSTQSFATRCAPGPSLMTGDNAESQTHITNWIPPSFPSCPSLGRADEVADPLSQGMVEPPASEAGWASWGSSLPPSPSPQPFHRSFYSPLCPASQPGLHSSCTPQPTAHHHFSLGLGPAPLPTVPGLLPAPLPLRSLQPHPDVRPSPAVSAPSRFPQSRSSPANSPFSQCARPGANAPASSRCPRIQSHPPPAPGSSPAPRPRGAAVLLPPARLVPRAGRRGTARSCCPRRVPGRPSPRPLAPPARPTPAPRRPSGRGRRGAAKPPRPRSAPIESARRRLGHPPTASRGAAGARSGAVRVPGPLFPTHTHLGSISSADRGTPATHVTLIPPPASGGSCGGMHPPHPQPSPLGGPGMGDGEGSADIHARSWGASARGDNLRAGRRAAWQPAALTGMDLGGAPAPPGGLGRATHGSPILRQG